MMRDFGLFSGLLSRRALAAALLALLLGACSSLGRKPLQPEIASAMPAAWDERALADAVVSAPD